MMKVLMKVKFGALFESRNIGFTAKQLPNNSPLSLCLLFTLAFILSLGSHSRIHPLGSPAIGCTNLACKCACGPRLFRAFSLPVPAWSQMPVFGFKESSGRGLRLLKPNTKENRRGLWLGSDPLINPGFDRKIHRSSK